MPIRYKASEWMYKNQLGRRNLTDEQRAYTIGKMYEARKKSQGEHKGNQYMKLEKDQNDLIPKDKPKSTAEAIGRELTPVLTPNSLMKDGKCRDRIKGTKLKPLANRDFQGWTGTRREGNV